MFSNNAIIELYRTAGITSVELYLNEQLTKKSYWENYLTTKNTQYGYYESIEYIVTSTKDNKEISIQKNEGGNYKEVFKSSIITGEADGDKRIEGDLKTPLGAYKLTQKKTKLDQFYGPLAFVTNYPNKFDRIQGKTGSGIWIHGMPFDGDRPPFTKGCIALENDELTNLAQNLNINNAVLIIDNNKTNESKEELALVLAELFSWKHAWQENNLDGYLSYYSNEFIKSNGMQIKDFKRYKTRIFAKNEPKSILYKDINIIPYPNSINKKMYHIEYFQDYKAPSFQSKNKKELYIEIIDNKMQILFET
jgi:murein L,D-transpeptidase YafK